jgi:ATP-dependent DNA helicase RecQ
VIDQLVNVSEKSISFNVKQPVDVVIKQLGNLHNYRIIDYVPRKEKPQVYLFQNRIKSDDLKIDTKKYNKRKRQYEERVKAMQLYVETTNNCRSVMIGKYFGDPDIQPCGICDNCINKKKQVPDSSVFDRVAEKIFNELRNEALSFNALNERLKDVPKHTLREVVTFLQSEQKIVADEVGQMHLKNASLPAASSQS